MKCKIGLGKKLKLQIVRTMSPLPLRLFITGEEGVGNSH